MATTIEIINGISQALSNSHDGAVDQDGEPVKLGLRREEGNPLIDERVMDGFGASVHGDRLHIKYHCELTLSEVHNHSFESDIEEMVEKVKSFIKKEYKKETGSAVNLSEPSEIQVFVEYLSRKRTSVKAHKCWKIGNIEAQGVAGKSSDHKDPVADATRKWIEQGKKAKKPENVTIKS